MGKKVFGNILEAIGGTVLANAIARLCYGDYQLRLAGVDRYRTLFAADPSREWLQFGGGLRLVRYNVTAPLEREGAPVTSAPDANVAAR